MKQTTIRTRAADLLASAADQLLTLALRLNPAGADPVPRYGIRIVPDEDYLPEPAGDDAESLEWQAREAADLEAGRLAAYGFIVIRECPECGDVDEADVPDGAIWGVLLDPATLPAWEATADRVDAWDLTTLPHLAWEVAADVMAGAGVPHQPVPAGP